MEQDADSEGNAEKGHESVKVKDFQVLINLADFMKAVLEDTKTELFSEWAYTFCYGIIKLSSE